MMKTRLRGAGALARGSAPSPVQRPQAGGLEVRLQRSGHRLDIHWHFLDEHDLTILPPTGHTWTQTIERWDWSPIYGKKELAKVLRFSTETFLPAEFAVLLVLSDPGTFTQSAPGAYHYKEPQGSHECIFGDHFTYRATGPAGVTEFSL